MHARAKSVFAPQRAFSVVLVVPASRFEPVLLEKSPQIFRRLKILASEGGTILELLPGA